MQKVRGFEIAKGFENQGINIPTRKTKTISFSGLPSLNLKIRH
jgi:hypothetical protein